MHGSGCLTPATHFCSPAQGLRLRRFVDGSSPTGTPAAALAAAEQRSLQAQQTYGQRRSSLSVRLTARSSNTTRTLTCGANGRHHNPGLAGANKHAPPHQAQHGKHPQLFLFVPATHFSRSSCSSGTTASGTAAAAAALTAATSAAPASGGRCGGRVPRASMLS